MGLVDIDVPLKTIIYNPCVSSSIGDGMRMIAGLKLMFAVGCVLHGIYISIQSTDDLPYGIVYACSGIGYFILSGLLWTLTNQPTVKLCQKSIAVSLLLFVVVLITTICRNIVHQRIFETAVIWIGCGIFLETFMIWVLWAFMKELETKTTNVNVSNQLPKHGILKNPYADNVEPAQSSQAMAESKTVESKTSKMEVVDV